MSHSIKRRRALLVSPELNETGIKVTSADPSFTLTGLNSHRGTQTIPEWAAEAILLLLLPDDRPTGHLLRPQGIVPCSSRVRVW
jgi:hypothetical protein